MKTPQECERIWRRRWSIELLDTSRGPGMHLVPRVRALLEEAADLEVQWLELVLEASMVCMPLWMKCEAAEGELLVRDCEPEVWQ